MLSTLPMDKKLKARIAIETLIYSIAFPVIPDVNTADNVHDNQNYTTENPSPRLNIQPRKRSL